MAAVRSLETPNNQRRTYVLDTNVLLYDPNAIEVFEDNELVIPITVIEEVDRFKKDLNETGRNARLVSRRLDELRHRGRLSRGVPLDSGGQIRVEIPDGSEPHAPSVLMNHSNDNKIIAVAHKLAQKAEPGHVILVTRDTNMRIKADSLGIKAEDYEHAHIHIDESFTGVREATCSSEQVSALYSQGWLPWEEGGVHPNEFLILKAEDNPSQTGMARYDAKQKRLKPVGKHREGVWGIFARNKEQLFALDMLLDDSIDLVTIDGMAGTGKTLMAIACGLKRVADDRSFRRLVVSRPIFPLGKDMGFLPGDVSEKLNPWMKPIFDNLDLLLGGQEDETRSRARGQPSYQALLDQGILEVEPLTYIRGRSMPRQWLVVDEAQNLTPHEVKTVLTRAGEGTKIILTGDPYQIDNPYVDSTSNGLTYVVERFKNSTAAGHVTLRKGERSQLAELAATLL
ncbi:MAG: PhoH family protein [Myxococcota bacterium]|nr:PhoH family protein [Myxococcota bacterium]